MDTDEYSKVYSEVRSSFSFSFFSFPSLPFSSSFLFLFLSLFFPLGLKRNHEYRLETRENIVLTIEKKNIHNSMLPMDNIQEIMIIIRG